VRALAVLQGAVDGERDALREGLDEAPLVARGPAPDFAPAERDDADVTPVGDERDERRAAAEHRALAGVVEEDRLVGAHRARDLRVAFHGQHAPAAVGSARVGPRAAQVPREVEDVQRARVGDARHEQLCHLLQGVVAHLRAFEQRARVGQ
jgi:hypothetical protein